MADSLAEGFNAVLGIRRIEGTNYSDSDKCAEKKDEYQRA
jgi:hypothetical protein